MQETWLFLDSGHQDAATNMAIDEALLAFHSKGEIPPTIRFYGWKRPSLTIGYFQNVEKTIHLDNVDKLGCDFVRRLTGGSAVLHDQELTYSIIVSESHPLIPKSINEAYYVLSQGILEGYRALGIDASFALPNKEQQRERTAVCFEKPAIYEMLVDGKKISGNAQTRKDGVLLQHGSIPMQFDTDMLFDLFKFPSERVKARQQAAFAKKAISINDITQKEHTYDMLQKAFKNGFQKSLDIRYEPLIFTNEQLAYIEHLVETKYRTKAWNEKVKKNARSV